jgi:hypothetical protein
MKNIHILPTDNQYKGSISLTPDGRLTTNVLIGIPQHIYITSNEDIKDGDWCLSKLNEVVRFGKKFTASLYKKVILTTDQDLIKDGVHAIDDEFLVWFVKNPSCESVEVNYDVFEKTGKISVWEYDIIIPQEEQCTCKLGEPYNNACCKVHGSIPKEKPKQIKCYCGHTITCDCEPLQETLEEFINQSNTPEGLDQFSYDKGLEDGAKWQKERMEEDMINFAHFYFKEEFNSTMQTNKLTKELLSEWFEQNKNK